ncbi:MAG TPA: PxKF domain-containing protein [Gemmatimonadales bacterium]
MCSHRLRLRHRAAVCLILLAACDGDRPFSPEPEPTPGLPAVSASYAAATLSQVSYAGLPSVTGVVAPLAAGAGINGQGWVAGSTAGYFGGLSVLATHATLWTPAGARDLGVVGQAHSSKRSWATDVNDAGVVVGYATGATTTGGCCTAVTAFLWTEAGGMTALPRLAEGKMSTAGAVNSAGHVAGSAYDAAGVQHAVVWKGADQPPVDLGVFGGSWAVAADINDAGMVVGSVAGGAAPGVFRWSEGSGVQMLGHLGGWAEARAVNEAGHVVGFATLPDDSQHPFRWTPGSGLEDLGLPPGAAHAQATGINEAGHIAVTATYPDDGSGIIPTRAYLWVEGSWIDLGEDLGWSGAAALNDDGQVAGYGLSQAAAANEAARWSVELSQSATYDFEGFFPPVDNAPAVNQARAGSAIPVKFSLGGDEGLEVMAAGYPASQPTACEAGAPIAPVEETAGAGGSGLSYDPMSGQYTYVWKTQRSWAGSCRRLTVRLDDGTERSADFEFTR